jgi:hypothetical protein
MKALRQGKPTMADQRWWQRLAALAFGLAVSCGPAVAQELSAPDIVVTGERWREVLREFADAASAEMPKEDQLATWERRVCPGVIGLGARQAQFVIDRIAQRAHDVGLGVRGPGCRIDVLIFFTPDADRLAGVLADDYDDLFGVVQREDTVQSLGQSGLAAFVASDQPVRWWHVSRTYTGRGGVVGDGGAVTVDSPSRVRRSTNQRFTNVVIIVDVGRAQGVRFDAMADYLSMVALAQLDPQADFRPYPTVMNLFEAASPQSMTDWDRAYLRGLYAARPNAVSSDWQERDIARRMEEALTPPTATTPAQ